MNKALYERANNHIYKYNTRFKEYFFFHETFN